MRKRISIFMGTLILLVALVGCQNQKEGSSSKDMAEGSTENTVSEKAAKSDVLSTGESNIQADGISEEQAKEIALEDAGVLPEDVTAIRVTRENDDGYEQYEVEFYVGGKEYDYAVDAANGSIRSKDMEIENDFPSADSTEIVSEEDAMEIILEKVPGATTKDVRIKLDYEDGKQVYEGKIVYDSMEYEFEISASDGKILSWESESVFD